MKKYLWVFLISSMAGTVAYSKDIIETIKASLDLCLNTLVPSLFPFLVFSKMMILSGSAEYMGKVIHPITGRLFNLSENGSFLFVIGILCGYPIGAKCISDMLKNKKISYIEAERLILFCNNSGPLFVIGAIGCGMYSDIKTGVIIYLAHILSAFVIGLVTRNNQCPQSLISHHPIKPYFTQSVEDSMIAVINISGYVLFFSAVCTIINCIMPSGLRILKVAICSLLEITGGIKVISSAYSIPPQLKILITAFLVGFGGICVLFQTKSAISDSGIKILPYLCSKLCQGALSVFFAYMIMSVYPLRSCAHISSSNMSVSTYMLIISLVLIIIYIFKLQKRSNKTYHY